MKTPSFLGLLVLCLGVSSGAQPDPATGSAASLMPGVHVVTLGVSDLRKSFTFYRDGLGFPTRMTPDGGIVLFTTSGAKLFLYPYPDLARSSGVDLNEAQSKRPAFPWFTLSHGVLRREEVDLVLQKAKAAGGKVVKPAHEVSWGAYVGYFSDPDGFLWEVAYSDRWYFSPEGVLIFRE